MTKPAKGKTLSFLAAAAALAAALPCAAAYVRGELVWECGFAPDEAERVGVAGLRFDESGCGADYEPQGGAGGDGDIRFRSPAQDYETKVSVRPDAPLSGMMLVEADVKGLGIGEGVRPWNGAVRIIDSRNVVFDGPTILDSCCWCVAAFNSRDLELANLKVTGPWRYNTDGIDICNSQRVRVHGCYVHSFDDALVVKGISHDYVEAKKVLSLDFTRNEPIDNVRFSDCVCWCGWGRTLELGLETWADYMRGIVFENCDLIHNAGVAMSVHLGGPAVVEDATFRNMRIECDGSEECSVLQRSREQKAVCPPGNRCLWLAVENAKMFGNGPYATTHDFSDEPYGTIKELTVENIAILRTNGAPAPDCRIAAEPGTAFGALSISNVTLDGVGIEGPAR